MASSRGTSNGPDWQDVAQAVLNYEKFNTCAIKIVIEARPGQKASDLLIVASAYERNSVDGEASRWASASVSCRQQGYVGLEAAIMKSLYDLDVALYSTAL